MSVSELTSADNFRITLSSSATAEAGEVVLTSANFAQAAGTYGSDEITNDSGVAGATVSAALDAVEL